MLLLTLIAAIPEQPIYTVYLPVISRHPDKFGIAWPDVDRQDISMFRASVYQGWTINLYPVDGMMALPHIPCPYGYWWTDPDVDFLGLLTVRLTDYRQSSGRDYDGILLVLNEPDLESQCYLSPEDAIEFYEAVAAICPACQLTLPQVSHHDYWNDWQWLRSFLALYRANEYYPPVTYGAVHSYVWGEHPSLLLDSYESVLDGYGLRYDKWIVSEWGACTADSLDMMYRWYEQDDRVLYHLYFAPYVEGNCSNLFIDFDGTGYTAMGEKLIRLRD